MLGMSLASLTGDHASKGPAFQARLRGADAGPAEELSLPLRRGEAVRDARGTNRKGNAGDPRRQRVSGEALANNANRTEHRRSIVFSDRLRVVPPGNQRPTGKLHDRANEVGRLWLPAPDHWRRIGGPSQPTPRLMNRVQTLTVIAAATVSPSVTALAQSTPR